MSRYPQALLRLISAFSSLPGVGRKTAERFAFHLLSQKVEHRLQISEAISSLEKGINFCSSCGSLAEQEVCSFCSDPLRDRTKLCVLAFPKELFAIEETAQFFGLYHILGKLLSPMDSYDPSHLAIDSLMKRVRDLGVTELFLALDATVEGDATALYLQQELSMLDRELKISRLAYGLPMGTSLDYVDGSTLGQAILGRRFF